MGEALTPERVRAGGAAPGQLAKPAATVTLAVDGMHCGNCMRKVEEVLEKVPGVATARVNLSSKRVVISLDDAGVKRETLIDTVTGAGFPASVLQAQAKPKPTEDDYLKRVGVAGFAAANIMLLSVAVWSGQSGDMPKSLQTMFHWLSALIALPAVAYAGQPFYISAARAIRAGRLNMDVPISLGVTLATVMSLYQTMRGSQQVYFDAAVSLLFFLLIGRALDQSVRQRASSAAENLLGLRSPSATVIQPDGRIERLELEQITPGMVVLVAAGERVPVDGRILGGDAQLDEALLTGESRPRQAQTGEAVYAGTINLGAAIEIETTAVNDNSLLAEIARLVETAEQARGRYVRLADRAARLYAPAVHILGLGTFIGWVMLGYGWEPGLTAAVAVLIITCPCALALAVPAVQVVATGRLMRSGIVLKASDGLERLAEVDTIVFDKTGTLTRGEPRLVDEATLSAADLAAAAGLAARSRHPYARAVVVAARSRGIVPADVEDVIERTGLGLEGIAGGVHVRLGSAAFCGLPVASDASLAFQREGQGAILLPVTDGLRSDARATVEQLVKCGYGVEVLSGDRPDAVVVAAAEVGIGTAKGGVKPDEKLAHIEGLKSAGRHVLMVGDGLNDAPALAAGHASISPATGADVSQAAADAVFQGERLGAVVEALRVAKLARRYALENFAIAIGYNIVFVPMAVVGLVTPLIAAIAMSASSLAVTLNALRLARVKKGVMS
ncbi:MAG TPA: heavy metal translocating P-type ATPase [Hyphomicrobiaceae bacterium]|nr:heavy metal translocating P-type ATPase [Hyphomicrobiaceae bacterium]